MNLPPNPYAPPTEPQAIPHAWHGAPWQAYARPNPTFRTHGTDAIITIGAYLPDVCVKCCRKEGLTRRSFPLTRHPTWLYGLLALGLLPYFVVRSGFARGWASFCLCGYCYTRYQNAGLAKWVVALPVLTWTSMLGSLWALGLEGLEEEAALSFVVSLFLFLVTAGLAWLVLSQFSGPRTIHLEEVIFREMRVSGFDRDALADCAAYAAYWANAQAHPWPAQASYPAPEYYPHTNTHSGYGARPPGMDQMEPAAAVFAGGPSASPVAGSDDTLATAPTAASDPRTNAAAASAATAESALLAPVPAAETPAEPTSPTKVDTERS